MVKEKRLFQVAFANDTRRFVNSKNPSLPGGKKGF
jgi:hypothetical protein